MSVTPTEIAPAEDRDGNAAGENGSTHSQARTSPLATPGLYALAGFAATLLLGFVEWIDLNIKLTPVLESFSERFILTAYFSLDLLVGAIIGLVAGLAAYLTVFFYRKVQRGLAGKGEVKLRHNLVAALTVSLVAGALLYFQPGVFRFTLGAIREAEKIAFARVLLKTEPLFTYLAITGMFILCWALAAIARASKSMRPLLRVAWMLLIILTIAGAYYIDSRIEVQQYEFSLHRAMFLLELALAMALVASLYHSFADRFSVRGSVPPPLGRALELFLNAVFLSFLAFTFVNFDKNQNLKAHVFSRSTITKQFFKLTQWGLDFDRDGYSALLGGGDANDTRASINPGQDEIVGDAIDNNCIGGDLSEEGLADWLRFQRDMNSVPSPEAKRLNVIFIFVDTVRADHLSVYGYGKDTTPNLSKLAERACVFDNAFTPSPSTYQAVPKFMQSSYWDAHLETWTEVLARNGYNTVLFPGRREATLYRRIKDPQMISSARTNNLKETVDAVTDRFSKTSPDQPFCAYVYTFEPHMPYRLRNDFYFGPSLADRYDGEIAYVDHHLGRLFEWLESSGRINDTMVVVMSDHGESLGERGVYKHNSQLYNEQMHVPMIVYVPNTKPRRVADYVSTIDLGSTILNAVGIDCPKDYVGVSLLPMLRGDRLTLPPVFGEHWQRNDSPFLGPEHNVDPEIRKFMIVTQDGYKLIYNRNAFTFELFSLRGDPGEQHNLYDRMPAKAAEMKRLLGRFIDVVSVSRPSDADEQRFLRGSHDDEESK